MQVSILKNVIKLKWGDNLKTAIVQFYEQY